jgi:hypothetical protein
MHACIAGDSGIAAAANLQSPFLDFSDVAFRTGISSGFKRDYARNHSSKNREKISLGGLVLAVLPFARDSRLGIID